jgi:hypothetical protein
MSRYDAAAMPLYNSFGTESNPTPFQLLPPEIDPNAKNTPDSYGARASAKMDFDDYESCPHASSERDHLEKRPRRRFAYARARTSLSANRGSSLNHSLDSHDRSTQRPLLDRVLKYTVIVTGGQYLMLVIRRQQIEAFEKAVEDAFSSFVSAIIRRDFPKHVQALPDPMLRARTAEGVRRAKAYGLTLDNDIVQFVALLFTIHWHFDHCEPFASILAETPACLIMSELFSTPTRQDWIRVSEGPPPAA